MHLISGGLKRSTPKNCGYKRNNKKIIEGINIIIDSLNCVLKKEGLSFEERKFVMEKLEVLTEMLERIDARNKGLLDSIYANFFRCIGIGHSRTSLAISLRRYRRC